MVTNHVNQVFFSKPRVYLHLLIKEEAEFKNLILSVHLFIVHLLYTPVFYFFNGIKSK